MSDEDFFQWLRSKGINEKDRKTLSGKMNNIIECQWIALTLWYYDSSSEIGVTASAITQLDAEDFNGIGLTLIGKKVFLKAFSEIKGMQVHQSQVESVLLKHT